MAKKILPLFLVISFFCSCGLKKTWHTSTFFFFDTICELRLYCAASEFESAQEEVNRIFEEIEKEFSPSSEDFNSPLVLELFEISRQVNEASKGYFDITVGPLSELWGFQEGSHRIPTAEEITNTLQFVGMGKIKTSGRGLILIPGMRLDWGGIAKGLAIDLAAQSLISLGMEKGFLNAGGDLYCWGTNPENELWNVGIKHPRKEGFLGVLSISNMAAATSGDYQRYFEVKGIRYHHIFNPFTGYPAQGKQSVTVVGPETTLCDALSTAIFVSPNPSEILHEFPEYGAIIVNSKGKISRIGKEYLFEEFLQEEEK